MTARTALPPSLWASTAIAAPATTRLQGDLAADCVVVGAGFTGLSAALHLAEAGRSVVVLEAADIGFGGSGRNGGQVNPGLKLGPAELARQLGKPRAEAVFRATETSVDLVFELVRRHQLDCHLERTGFLYASTSRAMLARTKIRHDWLRKAGIDAAMLDADETARRVGHQTYCGSLFDPRGGALQPLSFARELARVGIKNGVQLFTQSSVNGIKAAANRWQVRTANGTVTANTVLLCTNAYTDFGGAETLWPRLARTIVPVFSFQVATKPLGDDLRRTILPGGHTVSNTWRLPLYYRYDHGGRLLMGGRGTAGDSDDIREFGHLIAKVSELFPVLRHPEIDFHWSGKVAITPDGLPHIHNPAPAMYAGLGFNGRGVAMGTLLGQWLSVAAMTGQLPTDALPLTPIRPIPLHRWRRAGINIAIQIKELQDRLGI